MWTSHWTVPSASEPDRMHRVVLSLGPDPVTGEKSFLTHCDCRGYYYGNRRHLDYRCRHIREALRYWRMGLGGGDRQHPFPLGAVA